MTNRKHRIALFSQDLFGGGAQKVIANLATGLSERGLAIDMVLVRPEGPFLDILPSSVRIVDLGKKRTVNSIFTLAGYLRREKPIALLSALTHVNVAAIIAARIARVPTRIVVSEHSLVSRSRLQEKRFAPKLGYRLIPYLYPMANEIIAVSKHASDDLASFCRLPKGKIKTIYNPVVTPQLKILSREPAQHPWFHNKDTAVILAVGRLTPAKDYPTMIQAFALVRKQCAAKLLILGEGPERSFLENLAVQYGIQEDVSLPGFVTNPYAFISRADTFVLSSAWEGFGNVLVEALACGTRIVSTDCPGGPKEILQGGRFGSLVPPKNPKALANALILSLNQKNNTDVKLLQHRAKDFTLDHIAKLYEQLLLGENR